MTDGAIRYCRAAGIDVLRRIGDGKDGTVYETSRPSAVKEHVREESYQRERDAYLRLRDRGVRTINGLRIPSLWAFDDELRVIEMSIVRPAFIVDFASAWLDKPPDFPDDVISTWHDEINDRFGARAPDVFALLEALAKQAGVYVLDVHPHNIKFE